MDKSTLPVIDNEKHRAVRGYVWSVVDVMAGDLVYEHFEGMEGKLLLGCWTHARRKAYPEIRKFETWMEATLFKCPPKSLMEGAIYYTYNILKKLSLYVTDGRYKIDDNMVENSIMPLAIGRLCGVQHKDARITYSAETTMPRRTQP